MLLWMALFCSFLGLSSTPLCVSTCAHTCTHTHMYTRTCTHTHPASSPFVPLLMDIHWHVLAIVKSAAVSIGVRVPFQVTALSGCVSRSGVLDPVAALAEVFWGPSLPFPQWLHTDIPTTSFVSFRPWMDIGLLPRLTVVNSAAVSTGVWVSFWIRVLSSSVLFSEDITLMYHFYVVNSGCAGSGLLGRLFPCWGAGAALWLGCGLLIVGVSLVAQRSSRSQRIQ